MTALDLSSSVAVVGTGTMGQGIAQVALVAGDPAQHGADVVAQVALRDHLGHPASVAARCYSPPLVPGRRGPVTRAAGARRG